MEPVLQWVSTYGYGAIFGLLLLGVAGLPVPDEWLLVFSGYLVFSGRLNGPAAWFAALGGSIAGITLSYLIGRRWGLPLLHSRFGRYTHISDHQIQHVHDWFRRAGSWTLVVGYYIPGVRHFTALAAGTSLLEFPSFALYAYSGALVWVSTFLFIGYHFGERWRTVLHVIERNLRLAAVIGLALIALYVFAMWIWRRTRSKPGG